MGTLTSVAGWFLTKVTDTIVSNVIGRATQSYLNKMGVFDATCEKCKTKQSGIVIPEEKPFTLKCPTCGHVGTIYIESLTKLIIHQVNQANIVIDKANILVNRQTNNNQQPEIISPPYSLLPKSGEIIESQLQPSNLSMLSDSDIEKLIKENAVLKERLSLLEKSHFQKNEISSLPVNEFQSTHGPIGKKLVENAIRDAIENVRREYYNYDLPSGAIKESLIIEIRLSSGESKSTDVLSPEICIVPKSREIIGKINAALNSKIGRSLKDIGLTLGKVIIRFDEMLPNK
jgi:hypothetical protein